jgi:hypothetical protein
VVGLVSNTNFKTTLPLFFVVLEAGKWPHTRTPAAVMRLTSVTVQEIKPKNDNVISDGEKLARGMSKGNLHRRNRLNRSVFPSDQRF